LGSGRSLGAASRSAVCVRAFSSAQFRQLDKEDPVPNMRHAARPRE
jgi:NADH dehydrogenase (ubiquinone) Fe-S protein 3